MNTKGKNELKISNHNELNELMIVSFIFKNWLKIAIVTLTAGVLVALYSLTMPNIFKSSSALIINTPETPLSGEVEPLDAKALQILASSQQIKQALYQKAKDQALIDDNSPFTNFQNTMTATVRSDQQNNTQDVLPLVELSVKNPDPQTAGTLANIWAELVLVETRRIYQSGVEDFHTFANRALEGVEKELTKTEATLTNISLESNLDLTKREIENASVMYSTVLEKMQTLNEMVNKQTGEIEYLNNLKSDQSLDGIWLGYYLMKDDIKKIITSGQELNKTPESDLAKRIIQSTKRLIKNQSDLEQFEEKINIDVLEAAYKQAQDDLHTATHNFKQKQIELHELREKAKRLDSIIDQTPKRILLRKAITDDAYWQAYLSDANELKGNNIPKLITEMINPEYESLREEKTKTELQVSTLNASLKAMKDAQNELEPQIGKLKRKFLEAENRKAALTAEIQSDKSFLEFAEEEYLKVLKKYEKVESDLKQNILLHKTYRNELADIRSAQSDRKQIVQITEDRIAELERERQSLLDTRQGLAQKTREVNLLKISAADVSRSGVTIFYHAEPNPQKVGPIRTKMVLSAMAVSVLLTAFFLVLLNIVHLYRTPSAEITDSSS